MRETHARKTAQAKLDALLAELRLLVHYNPAAPWDAFLRPGPAGWATLGMAVLTLGVWGLAAVMFWAKQGG